jgi:hypothetical protein
MNGLNNGLYTFLLILLEMSKSRISPPLEVKLRQFSWNFYFEVFMESSCISTAECPAPKAGRYFLHGGMLNTSMDEGQNVPAPTGGFFYSQICNFPKGSFILSSPCNSANYLQSFIAE